MFYNKPSNNINPVNVNTHFFNSYSDTALLRVGAWNQHLSIKLQPAIGKDSSGITTYAQDQSQIISTSLTVESAISLYEGFEKEILPALEAKIASKKVSTIVSEGDRKKVISIFYDGQDAYIEIAVGVNDQNTTNDENVLRHKFNKRSYMVDYDYHTGNSGEVKTVETDFLNFMDKVKKVKDFTPAVVHTMKYASAIRNTFRNNQQQNNGFYNNGGGNYQPPQQQQVAQNTGNMVSSMDEFLPFA